jgi:hypothetical protein
MLNNINKIEYRGPYRKFDTDGIGGYKIISNKSFIIHSMSTKDNQNNLQIIKKPDIYKNNHFIYTQ